MSAARVQVAIPKSDDNSSATMTLTFPANVTAGNLIEVTVTTYASNSTTVTVTGTVNVTFTQAGSYATGSSLRVSKWYFANLAGGTESIAIVPSAGGWHTASAVEYSGLATSSPLVSTATNTSASSTAISTGSVTVNAATDLLTMGIGMLSNGGVCHISGQGTHSYGAPSGVIHHAADVLSATGNTNLQSTVNTSNSWVAIGACYKLASYPTSGGATPNVGIYSGGAM